MDIFSAQTSNFLYIYVPFSHLHRASRKSLWQRYTNYSAKRPLKWVRVSQATQKEGGVARLRDGRRCQTGRRYSIKAVQISGMQHAASPPPLNSWNADGYVSPARATATGPRRGRTEGRVRFFFFATIVSLPSISFSGRL